MTRNTKEICRLCLEERKNMRSVFDTYDKNVTYADLVNTFGERIMIFKNDAYDKMCSYCRRKVIDTHDFINLIQQSTIKLDQRSNKLIFDNITDIKVEELIDEKKVEIELKPCTVNIDLINGEDIFKYNDTTITKVEGGENYQKEMSLTELLNLQDDSYQNSDGYEVDFCKDSDVDLDDMPLIQRKNKKIVPEKKKRIRKPFMHKENHIRQILKPVIRKDLVLQKMIKKKNKNGVKRPATERRICPYCGKLITDYVHHILTHTSEKKFKCRECQKSFYTKPSLEKHYLNRHVTPHFLYRCDHCIAVFNSKGSIKSHMAVHFDVKKYVCEICNESFKRNGTLRRHKLRHQNKMVPCDHCSMTFRDKYRLQHHMRVHTRERPFNCEMCSQPYSYKRDFNRHCMKKHGVFLKQRNVYVMNEEVLQRERQLMSNLLLKVHGVIEDDQPLNPFTGNHSAKAFNSALEAIKNQQIPMSIELTTTSI